MPRLVPRSRLAVVLVLVALAVVIPASALASHRFNDVSTSNQFHGAISAIADAGITTGCSQGTNNYCPNGLVTRGQMAAFLSRLGALQPGSAPKVNADKLDGIDSSGFARSAKATIATTFANADKVFLTDTRTGAEFRLATNAGLIKIVNTGSATIQLAGMGTSEGSAPESFWTPLPPAGAVSLSAGGTGPSYLDFTIVTVGTTATATRMSHVTCSVVPNSTGVQGTLTCIVTG